MLDGDKPTLYNEAVRGDVEIDTLHGRRDEAKLKWWYMLVCKWIGWECPTYSII